MSITLRPMHAGDIEQTFALTQRLKWPHRREEWQQALELGEGVVAQEQGQVIGSAIAWRWGDEYATIGLVIVDNQQQGRGIGKQLMLALLETLNGYNVRLHATEMGKGLYEKLGFVATGQIKQLQTRALAAAPPVALPTGVQLRRAAPQDAQTLACLDRQAHGMWRPALITALINENTQLLQDRQGNIQGFASLRRFGHGWAIGPIIARDLAGAQALIAALMQQLQGEFVRIDVDAALPLAAWLQSLGLDEVDAPTTMVRGTPWQPEPAGMQAFGLMTQAMA